MRRIVTYLRGRGINAWVDNEKLVPGTPIWEEEIEKAIRGAFAVIVILSPASKSSEWVRREVTLVDNSHKRVFPVLIAGGEEEAIPIRLITKQFVDLRKNEEEGLQALGEAILRYRTELETQEKIIAPIAIPKSNQSEAPAEAVRSPAMEEIIRIAREREREQRAQATQGRTPPPAQPKTQQKKNAPIVWLALVGGVLLCVFMVTVGPMVWRAMTAPPPTQPAQPADSENIIIQPVPTNTPIPPDTAVPPTATFTSTVPPSPTWTTEPTFTPTYTPLPTFTDTPPAPSDPVAFITYYFDTIVFQKDYQKCWSLLTPDYQVNKAGGWNQYTEFWGTVKNWTRSSISTEYNNGTRARVLMTYRLYYYSGSSDPVDGVRYCLLWNPSMSTWQIDLRENCP
jgi:hypothetical protein